MRIEWDVLGDRKYTQGISQAVMYDEDGLGVAWNGLISVTEVGDQTMESKYVDGRKYRNRKAPSIFAGTISAYTYPDELEPYIGVSDTATAQGRKTFGLTYRTNREIHVVYNIMAAPAHPQYATVSEQINLSTFDWAFTTQPEKIPGGKPSSHFVIMVEDAHPLAISSLEAMLYGNDITDPMLPTPEKILDVFESNTTLRITDNWDGTWTAVGPDDVVFTIVNNQFKIVWPSIIFMSDPTVFKISSGWNGILELPTFFGGIKQKRKQIAAAGSPFSTVTGAVKRKKMTVVGAGTVTSGGDVSIATGAVKQKKMTVAGSSTGISVTTGGAKQKKMTISAITSAGTIVKFISGYGPTGTNSRAITVTAATQAGDTLLVVTSTNSSTSYPTSLIDSKGNIYTLDRSSTASAPAQVCWRSPGATGGPAGAPTVALTTSDTLTVGLSLTTGALSIIGAALPNTLVGDYDVIPASISTATDTTPTATATPATDRDIAIGMFSHVVGGGNPTINAPFSNLGIQEAGTYQYSSMTYRILPAGTSGSAQTSTETITSGLWKAILYLFKPVN